MAKERPRTCPPQIHLFAAGMRACSLNKKDVLSAIPNQKRIYSSATMRGLPNGFPVFGLSTGAHYEKKPCQAGGQSPTRKFIMAIEFR